MSSEAQMSSEEQAKLVAWMDEATGAVARVDEDGAVEERVHGTLSVTRFRDAFWYLSKPIDWSPDDPGQGLPSVSVPIGFVTDFASIPRALWTTLPRDGDYVWPAVVHDYLYWTQTTTKEVADNVLNAAMLNFDIPFLTRTAIFQGVALGGGPSWANNAELKRNGEKRVLKEFPDSPTISWEQWKTKPGVFAP
jgi:hypothetical protein